MEPKARTHGQFQPVGYVMTMKGQKRDLDGRQRDVIGSQRPTEGGDVGERYVPYLKSKEIISNRAGKISLKLHLLLFIISLYKVSNLSQKYQE